MSLMRGAQKLIAMIIVGFAVAMSVSYVIPNAQAVEPAMPGVRSQAAGALQVAEGAEAEQAVVGRDGYSVTLPPPPPPPPPPRIRSVGSLTPSSSTAELQWPVPQGTKILSPFGPRSCSGCSSNHLGVDLGAPGGSSIWAMAAGTVIETNAPGYAALGVHARIQHVVNGEVVTTVYAHMVSGSLQVSVGDQVSAGQVLGSVGCTGSCTGNHLHFEVHPGGGAATDPVAWFNSRVG
jgi:murein DD-endopeptidase MepM/ murein hydrolase activator NlpD